MGLRDSLYANISDEQWSDWRWQQQNRIVTLDALERIVTVTSEERRAFLDTADRFRMAITPYYANLIRAEDPQCPIRQQAVPSPQELRVWPGEREDPLAEEKFMPVPGLTHRYPDRALLYTTHNCAMYCRFCTRKRKVGDPATTPPRPQLSAALDYIRRTPGIRDVIVSGGDPLSLSNERLAAILESLSQIPHVAVARIGTRNLVTLPQRVDEGLATVLRDHQTRHLAVYVMTHFNHPRECTEEAWSACDRVASTGTPIQNQMVLLAGINDCVETVRTLCRRLLQMRVKPYYILHADMAEGIGHFRTTIEAGRQLLDGLRGHVSGLAVPQYVVDLPGGGGKVPVLPDYVLSSSDSGWTFRNYQNRPFDVVE